jgi:predicted CopG family antitoxin
LTSFSAETRRNPTAPHRWLGILGFAVYLGVLGVVGDGSEVADTEIDTRCLGAGSVRGFDLVFREMKPAVKHLCLCTQAQAIGTKTIRVREDVYERLRARKRDDESFTDLMDRLLDESKGDWREGFGTLDEDDAAELEELVEQSRERLNEGLATRQQNALEELSELNERGDADETA